MQIAGIILIVLQVVGIIGALIGGRNPFSGGFFETLGYFLIGITGVILLIVARIRKKKQNNDSTQNKHIEIAPINNDRNISKDLNDLYCQVDTLISIDTNDNDYKMKQELSDKYTRMFRQSFDNVINREIFTINNYRCVMYRFSPITSDFDKIGGFSHMIIVLQSTPRYFTSEHSFDNKFVLCEWIFTGEIESVHINYGNIVSSIADTLNITANIQKKLKEILT